MKSVLKLFGSFEPLCNLNGALGRVLDQHTVFNFCDLLAPPFRSPPGVGSPCVTCLRDHEAAPSPFPPLSKNDFLTPVSGREEGMRPAGALWQSRTAGPIIGQKADLIRSDVDLIVGQCRNSARFSGNHSGIQPAKRSPLI